MPTYTFTRTREQLRDMVLRKLGAYEIGNPPEPEEALMVYEGIDLRLKELHKKQILWWQVSPAATTVLLTASTATLPADLLFAVTLKLTVGGEDRDIDLIDHRTYQDIQNKADTGEPTKALVSGQTAYLWPVPNATYSARLTYQAISADTEQNTAPDVPVSMLRPLSVLVSADLADAFQVPEAKVRRLMQEAEMAQKDIASLNAQSTSATPVTPEYF